MTTRSIAFTFVGLIGFCFALSFLVLSSAHAEGGSRTRVIDFEESVVEGVNKSPLDSFNQISEAEKRRRKIHLYKKRAGFRDETYQTLQEMRFEQ